LTDSEIWANREPGTLQMVLHEAGDVRIVFQHKNRLTQFVNLGRTRDMINLRLAHGAREDCERTMNREGKLENRYARILLGNPTRSP